MAKKAVQPHKDHIFIVEDDKGKKIIPLEKKRYSLGREKQCDIRIYSLFVSRHHATLIREVDDTGHDYYKLIDGDGQGKLSANGIVVNGYKVNKRILKHGDKIIFGPQVFAVYNHSQKDLFNTLTETDPYDITLIDPAMQIDNPALEEVLDSYASMDTYEDDFSMQEEDTALINPEITKDD